MKNIINGVVLTSFLLPINVAFAAEKVSGPKAMGRVVGVILFVIILVVVVKKITSKK